MTEESNEIQVQETEKQVAETEAERTRDQPAFVPRVDIYETDEAITVVADMPGVNEDSVDINLEKGILTINGDVDPEVPEGYSLAHAEYRVGDFVRSFALSNEINQDAIEATLKDGVLRITMSKITEAQTKKIAVKTG
jgi:HSP20 family protein